MILKILFGITFYYGIIHPTLTYLLYKEMRGAITQFIKKPIKEINIIVAVLDALIFQFSLMYQLYYWLYAS